ncbi:SCAN domain-containing protein 3-like [Palaemon carinicauda]|uniref:SCAN domain-containing protein 3-like n=1 Tax=Palaemon carinicauda TaxID=392227 RepID=UPI0035B62DA8
MNDIDSSAMSRKRTFKEEFLGTGFTCLIDHGFKKPQCVVCGEVLSHQSLKENKLKRHLQGKHPTLAGKDCEYLKRKEEQLKRQQLDNLMHTGLLQLDESTDISDDVQLLVYVQYQGKSDIEENFLFCKRLETTATGEDLFKLVDSFIKEEGLRWDQCSSVCSDGASAMPGARQGFTARVKQVNPTVIVTHCLLHRENLASGKMSLELNAMMGDVIQIVNFIKLSALNSRLFNQMGSDMGSEYAHLLYYSSVRWLSGGKMLQRVFDMHAEVEIFLNKKKRALASRLTEPRWLRKLAYLTNIFSELNFLNMSMRGIDETHLSVRKVQGYQELHEKYRGVRSHFDVHTEDLSKEESSIRNLQEELIEVHHDETLHFNFQRQSLGVFRTAVKKEKPVLGGEAVKEPGEFPSMSRFLEDSHQPKKRNPIPRWSTGEFLRHGRQVFTKKLAQYAEGDKPHFPASILAKNSAI